MFSRSAGSRGAARGMPPTAGRMPRTAARHMVKRTVCFISVARMSAASRDAHVPQVGDATEYRRLQRRSQVKPEGGEPWLSDQGLARLLVSSERMPQEKTTRMDIHVSAAGVGEECGAPNTRRHCLGDSTRQCSLKAFFNFAACLEWVVRENSKEQLKRLSALCFPRPLASS